MLGFLVNPILLMFPLSSGLSLDLLKEGTISTKSFIVASVLPFYSIFLIIKRMFGSLERKIFSKDDELYIQRVLINEETLFNIDDRHLFRWPVIQLYRNLLIVFVNIFILNPFYRCLTYVLLLFIFFTHDIHRMPYKHLSLNRLQKLSSLFLILVTLCNIPTSISMMGDVTQVPDMIQTIHGLKLVEMSLLLALPLLAVGSIAWDKIRRFNHSS